MLKLLHAVLLNGASVASGFAALGLALYANGPLSWQALQIFAVVGGLAGLLCAALHVVIDGVPKPADPALPADALASMVRTVLAKAAAERQARPGSAADRQARPDAAKPAEAPPALATTTAAMPAGAPHKLPASVPAEA